MKLNQLFAAIVHEATQKQELPKNKIRIVPAKLTFDEWYKIINPRDKHHGSDSYDWTVADMNKEYDTTDEDSIGKVYFSKKLKGVRIDFHGKAIENKYAKRDSEDNYLRTPEGDLIYLTPEEIKLLGHDVYNYRFVAVDPETDKIVGVAQDEWGALLISVAKEYRGFGIGEILGTLMRSYVPDYDTGGVTSAGAGNLKRVYRQMVNMAAERGDYSRWVRNGELSVEKALEILSTAKASKRVVGDIAKLGSKELLTNNPKDWVWARYSDMIIVYNKNLIEMLHNDFGDFNDPEHWMYELLDRFIVGGMYIGAGAAGNTLNIWQFGGATEKLKQQIFNVGMGMTQVEFPDMVVRVVDDISNLIDYDKVEKVDSRNSKEVWVIPTGYKEDYREALPKFKEEKAIRKEFDPYEEIIVQIAEYATKKYDDYV